MSINFFSTSITNRKLRTLNYMTLLIKKKFRNIVFIIKPWLYFCKLKFPFFATILDEYNSIKAAKMYNITLQKLYTTQPYKAEEVFRSHIHTWGGGGWWGQTSIISKVKPSWSCPFVGKHCSSKQKTHIKCHKWAL